MSDSCSTTTRPQPDYSFSESLALIADALQCLHASNLKLQDNIGAGMRHDGENLIEELQVLDRQAQVTLDLMKSLRYLAQAPPEKCFFLRFSFHELFELDATRHAIQRLDGASSPSESDSTEEFWV